MGKTSRSVARFAAMHPPSIDTLDVVLKHPFNDRRPELFAMSATPSSAPLTVEPLSSGHHQTRWTPPPGSTTITLLRHGASEGYVPGAPFPLVDGHGDPALAPDGHAQAVLAGARLAAEHRSGRTISALYVTTLTRTHQTAAPLAVELGLVPVVVPDLREVFLGDWEGGMFREKAAEGHPAAIEAIEGGEWGAVPGAETTAELSTRVMDALVALADRHRDQRIVCVVHGGVIAAAFSTVIGSRASLFLGADNCSISTLVRIGDRWRMRSFNDTAHLDGGTLA